MSAEEERRAAQIEALIAISGSMLTIFDVKSDAAELWPETMRNGTADEIRQVTAELADVLPAALLRELHPAEPAGSPSPTRPQAPRR